MGNRDFYNPEQPQPEHPANRDRSRDIAPLFALRDEWPDLQAICRKHGATLIDFQSLCALPAFTVEVLCPGPDTKLALMEEWLEFSAASPHRPRTDAERTAFGLKHHPFPDIPRDWTF